MNKTIIAKAVLIVSTSPAKVWAALIKPNVINHVDMEDFSDWQMDGLFTYTGKVLQVNVGKFLVSTFMDSTERLTDSFDSPKIIRFDLLKEGKGTRLTITFLESNSALHEINIAGQNRKVLHGEMKKLIESLRAIPF